MSNRKHRDNQEICARKVRELAQSGVNKHCFECGQPGVTYTDITVGSFVCTSCSGMLWVKFSIAGRTDKVTGLTAPGGTHTLCFSSVFFFLFSGGLYTATSCVRAVIYAVSASLSSSLTESFSSSACICIVVQVWNYPGSSPVCVSHLSLHVQPSPNTPRKDDFGIELRNHVPLGSPFSTPPAWRK